MITILYFYLERINESRPPLQLKHLDKNYTEPYERFFKICKSWVGEGVEKGGGVDEGLREDEGQVVMTNISLRCRQHCWPRQLHSLTEVLRHFSRKRVNFTMTLCR
jgi:hypothetical protein